MVSHYQGWKPFCVLGPPFRCLHMPVSQSFFHQSEGVLPSWMRDIAPGEYWDEILDGSSKDALSRRQLGAGVRGVMVLQYGSSECIGVEIAIWVCVVCDQLSKVFQSLPSSAGPTSSSKGLTL